MAVSVAGDRGIVLDTGRPGRTGQRLTARMPFGSHCQASGFGKEALPGAAFVDEVNAVTVTGASEWTTCGFQRRRGATSSIPGREGRGPGETVI